MTVQRTITSGQHARLDQSQELQVPGPKPLHKTIIICAAAPLWTQIVLVSLLAIWTIPLEQRGEAEDCATSSSPVKQFFVQAFILLLSFHLLPLLPRPAAMGDMRREQLRIQWKISVWDPHVWRKQHDGCSRVYSGQTLCPCSNVVISNIT